jgi:hypothetical protein
VCGERWRDEGVVVVVACGERWRDEGVVVVVVVVACGEVE